MAQSGVVGSGTPKAILLFADGTGNSSAGLYKTNVWRMYQAIDVSEAPPPGQRRQVACYNAGVGTSSFKPMQLLGGIFGFGLKRNVLELYRFVCRNYSEGDEIYLFGFSRGAFTVRVLAAMMLTQGILRCATEEELDRYVPDAYRRYRRRYKLPIRGNKKSQERLRRAEENVRRRRGEIQIDPSDVKIGLVDRLRDVRDVWLAFWRTVFGYEQYESVRAANVHPPEIRFIGVWDTVAAYGLPFEELTQAVDDWVWPLSMPNRDLSDKVLVARHALALDEERDSFQPLLWDERHERRVVRRNPSRAGRLQQVWFAGVHSDVGGGYAEESLAHVPLKWMMDEAEAADVRYRDPDQWGWTLAPDPLGQRHDSRSGVSAYYRPQSRRLVAKLESAVAKLDLRRGTRLLQDPRYTPPGLLTDVTVHESVLTRIKAGTDRYAPIILPPTGFNVFGQAGREIPSAFSDPNGKRTYREEWVFDDVWRRRVAYFAAVISSFLLLFMPLLQWAWPPSACEGPQCFLAMPLGWLEAILPGFVGPWLRAFQAAPGTFALLVVAILVSRSCGTLFKRRIEDGMRELWAYSYGLDLGSARPATKAAAGIDPLQPSRVVSRPDDWVYRLRTSAIYQDALHGLKWRWLPDVVGASTLVIAGLLTAVLLVGVGGRTAIALREAFGDDLTFVGQRGRDEMKARPDAERATFQTRWPTWPLEVDAVAGQKYRVRLLVGEAWRDGNMRSGPSGTLPSDTPIWFPLVAGTRRVLSEPWFKPGLRIRPADGWWPAHLQALEWQACGRCAEPRSFEAEFTANRSGRLSLFVNDALLSHLGITGGFYRNNTGSAAVAVDRWDGNRFREVWPRADALGP